MFEIGDRFVKKNTRDSTVLEIQRINHRFGFPPSYDMKPITSCGGRMTIDEETLIELYTKIN